MQVISSRYTLSLQVTAWILPPITMLLLFGLSGCRSHPAVSAPTATPVRSLAPDGSESLKIRSSPLYQQARKACERHDYRRAANLLQTLSQKPGLTSEAVTFCNTQRTLCLQEAGLLPKQPPVSPTHIPVVSDADCGPRALLFVCQKLGVKTDLTALRKTAGTSAKGTTMAGLQQAAEKLGLKAQGVQVGREALPNTSFPAIAWINRNHYIALLALSGSGDRTQATIHDPNRTNEESLSQEQLLQRSGGFFLLIHR